MGIQGHTKHAERERAWLRVLPVAVTLLGFVVSLSGWGYLVLDRQEEIHRISAEVAIRSRASVSERVRERFYALRSLSSFWSAVGRRPVQEWRADARALIETYPELSYVAWIYPDGHRARVAAGKYESPEDIEVETGDTARRGKEARIVGPERDSDGKKTFRILLPVLRGSEDLGMLEAQLDANLLLRRALEDSAPGYAIRVFWGDELLYARDEPSSDRWQRWWREEGSIRLPLDQEWSAIHAPTPALAAATLDPVPHYLLAVGIVLSIALGFLTYQLRLAYLRALFLAAGKEELEASTWELRRLNEVLETRVSERTQELESFTHSISHDLKSPLGAILNFSAILELDYKDRLDEEGREVLNRIRASAQRGTELLEGLLRLSRAGHADLQIGTIDMTQLARECFALARQSDVDPHVDFTLEQLPPAMGDKTLIREALINLFDNALKYSRGREKRRVSMRGRIEGEKCLYEVEDTGQGFDMRFSEKLFGLFQRLPSARDIEGTGVGLALVARIVHRHEGEVTAEGRLGEGAKFMFTLPACIEADE